MLHINLRNLREVVERIGKYLEYGDRHARR
jgi:hypothetical protein